ncbi:MAG TPA: hypothetical protein DCY13_18285, partial [Verrucomicrobiales bacterium]|nr:hypothetical protein [Verrucomicrobiales bacterium]
MAYLRSTMKQHHRFPFTIGPRAFLEKISAFALALMTLFACVLTGQTAESEVRLPPGVPPPP